MRLAPTSIRWRITLWLAGLLAGILAGFGVTAYQLERTSAERRIDDELERRVARLHADWRTSVPPGFGGPGGRRGPGGKGKDGKRATISSQVGAAGEAGRELSREGMQMRLTPETAALFADESPAAFYYAGWTGRGAQLGRAVNAPVEIPAPAAAQAGRRYQRTRDGWREVYQFTEQGDCVLAGISLHETQRAARRFAWWLTTAGVVVLAAGLGGTWIVTTRALRPVKEIGATASRIAAGNLAERIAAPDAASELGELATVLNATFARLDAAFAEQRNFTADASHELRTPIAALITTMQGLLVRERSGEDYREAVAACLKAVQQMRRLTESLLALARFDAGQEVLRREPMEFAEVVREAVEVLQPLAALRGITVEWAGEPVTLRGDAERLGQVVTNVVANAVHYNRDGGWVRVTTKSEEEWAVLEVADNGHGIAAEDLPHIFERFYRADKARSRSDGRSGLGLAICQKIVEAHGGEISATSEVGRGTTLRVRLPRGE